MGTTRFDFPEKSATSIVDTLAHGALMDAADTADAKNLTGNQLFARADQLFTQRLNGFRCWLGRTHGSATLRAFDTATS